MKRVRRPRGAIRRRTTPLVSPRRRGGRAASESTQRHHGRAADRRSCRAATRWTSACLWRIDELGGVALVGSVTPIHSGSGSAMVKAMSDAMLYRGRTLGEALRDAQNYLFCLEDLKDSSRAKGAGQEPPRGLELPALGRSGIASAVDTAGRAAGDAPLGDTFRGAGQTDDRRARATGFPRPAATKYFARMFPGSQPAGMVEAAAGDTARRVTPVYFFRLPLPDGFAADGDSLASRTDRRIRRRSASIRRADSFTSFSCRNRKKRAKRSSCSRGEGSSRSNSGGFGSDGQASHRAGGDRVAAAWGGAGQPAEHVPPQAAACAGRRLWQLTYNVSFHARKSGAKVRVSFPIGYATCCASSAKSSSAPNLPIPKPLYAEQGETRDIRRQDAEDGRVSVYRADRHSI